MNFFTLECLKKATFCKLADAQTMQKRTRFSETFELKFIRPPNRLQLYVYLKDLTLRHKANVFKIMVMLAQSMEQSSGEGFYVGDLTSQILVCLKSDSSDDGGIYLCHTLENTIKIMLFF